MKIPYLISCLAILASAPLSGEVLFSENFESGQTVGEQPTGQTALTPGSNTPSNTVQVVTGANNPAGGSTGNGVAMYNNNGSATSLEYNFVSDSSSGQSTFMVSFDLARLPTASAPTDNSRFSILLGAYNPSTSMVFNDTSLYYSEVRLRNNGLVGFIGNGTAGPNLFSFVAGEDERVKFTMVVNDLDSQAISYIDPITGSTESLAANSVAFFVDGGGDHDRSFTTLLNLGASTSGGTIETTENNFGRLGIYSSNGDELNYNFDNFMVTSLVPEPGHYAAMLGLIAIGLAWMRRRRQS